MKKLGYIAAVAAIALTSCQSEKDISTGKASDKKGITFTIQGPATRSDEGISPVTKGVSIPFAKLEGLVLTLEETVTDLNSTAPVTRGTPVYTENVGYLYKDMLGVYTDAAGGVDASYARLEHKMGNEGWTYQHTYTQNIWPDEDTDVQFYLYMPTDMIYKAPTDGTPELPYGVTSISHAGGVTTVEYTSPDKATAQEDIIFGGIAMDHSTYMGHYASKGGAPVTLYHALTGIKFAIADDTAKQTNLQIDEISFSGLKNKGKFTYTTGATAVVWDTNSISAEDFVMYQEYDENDLVTYSVTDHADQNFAASFFQGGVKNNLNDDQASKTFWFVPQDITGSDAILRIDYTFGSTPAYMEIELGELAGQNWQAGQLRTYTFKVNEVKVKIEDDVVVPGDAVAGEAFAGSYKENVEITNTGNTYAFIRAALVGQWMHEEEINGVVENNPVFGFTDNVNNLYVVESWYEDQFEKTTEPKHGVFEGLPGYKGQANPNANGWVLCTDGYYYYTTAVPPYDATKTKAENKAAGAICKPLFTKYTVKLKPEATSIAGAVMDVTTMHFELEVSAQAISAVERSGLVKKDSEDKDDWAGAWANALGSAPVKKQ